MHHRSRITVNGIVQGVGFRPFIYQLARRYNVNGWVLNAGNGVVIEIEGDEPALDGFFRSIRTEAPPLAVISRLEQETLEPAGYNEFTIKESDHAAGVHTIIPPDIATCDDCLEDISDTNNRRFGYPFTNCTNCGPRFTIIRSIPYDRPNTTMALFEMCPDCLEEYGNPENRRFHAQPNACPKCGPHLKLDGAESGDDSRVISKAASLLWEGKVLAIKGLGGYHLACDARNTEAVKNLRERKGRIGKPFAVMCRDLSEVRRICDADDPSIRLLTSPERPIVLLDARPHSDISEMVAPGSSTLGVMLPYTPLHKLLLAESPASLVMTSGNLSEEPIAFRDEDAQERLGHIADHFVAHDRPIYVACDDSVARISCGIPTIIRRARGYVPRPIEIDMDMPNVLACGADLKNTFCLTKDRLALLSQHLGDLDNIATLDHYKEVVEHFCRFFEVEPQIIAHDLHPDYRSTRFALSVETDIRTAVQHHHAHITSCMAENHLDGEVIGISFDGTGYGTDGCIWGGEFLVSSYQDFRRAGHLAYVPIPGGEAAIKRPGRMALSYLLQAVGADGESKALELIPDFSSAEAYAVRAQVERGLNTPLTSSMGRLFDAVSALLGICTEITYEAQAAIELQVRARIDTNEQPYPYVVTRDDAGVIVIDPTLIIKGIVEDIERGVSREKAAGKFHLTVAEFAAEVCRTIRDETGHNRVALSGGVFQNVLLLEIILRGLEESGFEVFRHSLVPTNDGGISLGQAVTAAKRYASLCV